MLMNLIFIHIWLFILLVLLRLWFRHFSRCIAWTWSILNYWKCRKVFVLAAHLNILMAIQVFLFKIRKRHESTTKWHKVIFIWSLRIALYIILLNGSKISFIIMHQCNMFILLKVKDFIQWKQLLFVFILIRF